MWWFLGGFGVTFGRFLVGFGSFWVVFGGFGEVFFGTTIFWAKIDQFGSNLVLVN